MSAPIHYAEPKGELVRIDYPECIACGRCIEICPMDVFRTAPDGKPAIAYGSDCSACMLCATDCPTKCITVTLQMVGNFVSVYDHLNIDVVPYHGPRPTASAEHLDEIVQGPETGLDWEDARSENEVAGPRPSSDGHSAAR